jgi:hypothetical protein
VCGGEEKGGNTCALAHRGAGALKEFLVNGGAFAARRLRVYIHSLYNRVVTDILVGIQLG